MPEFGLVSVFFSSKKLKAFVCDEADFAKGDRNAFICVLDNLGKLGSPTPLFSDQDVSTEVAPPDVSAIGLKLNVIFNNCGGRTIIALC